MSGTGWSRSRLLVARDAGAATWFPDGKWLYFNDYPVGKYLRKVPVAGGPPTVVRDDNAHRSAIAPDGATVYYTIELPASTSLRMIRSPKLAASVATTAGVRSARW